MKLDSLKVRKVTKPNSWRKVPLGQEGPKSPKNVPNSESASSHEFVEL